MSNAINIPLGQKSEEKTAKIVVGSNTFEVNVSPVNIEKIAYLCVEIGEALQASDDPQDIKKALKHGFNTMLGKGAFKKVFAESGSLLECTEVFSKVAKGLIETLPKPTQAQKAQQFVKNKNRKRKK